jgi:ubiquinone/menaquinone biosynthesis C-methylase UbiE
MPDARLNRFVVFAFRHFYTTFAWTYDAVAHVVSFGEWKEWGRAAMPFLPRGRVLEIAHGPGHLHLALRRQGYDVVGIDLSRQMSRMAHKRMRDGEIHAVQLCRANATRLPFRDGAFAAAVSTFPSGFIFQRDTLDEVRRVVQPSGIFAIVPGATLRGSGAAATTIALAYRITGQGQAPEAPVRALFESAGFEFNTHIVSTSRADVTVWVCGRGG